MDRRTWVANVEHTYDALDPSKHVVESRLFTCMKQLTWREMQFPHFDLDFYLIPTLEVVNRNPNIATRFSCQGHPERCTPADPDVNFHGRGYITFVVRDNPSSNHKTVSALAFLLQTIATELRALTQNDYACFEVGKLATALYEDQIDYLIDIRLEEFRSVVTEKGMNVLGGTYNSMTLRFWSGSTDQRQAVIDKIYALCSDSILFRI